MKTIQKISFISEGERIFKECDEDGKFKFYDIEKRRSGARTIQKTKTAMEFVMDDKFKNSDPTLTFTDGYKLRVYQSGDPSYMLSEAISLIEIHDEYYSFIGEEKTIFDDDGDFYDDDYYMNNGLFSFNFSTPQKKTSYKPNFKIKPKGKKTKLP